MDRIIFLAGFGIAVRSYFFTAMTAKAALSHVATMEGIPSGRCIFVWMNSDFMIEWMSII